MEQTNATCPLTISGRPTDAELDQIEAVWNCWIVRIHRVDGGPGDRPEIERVYELIMMPRRQHSE